MAAPNNEPHEANIGIGMITNPTKTNEPIEWLCNHDVIRKEANAEINPITANQQPAIRRAFMLGLVRPKGFLRYSRSYFTEIKDWYGFESINGQQSCQRNDLRREITGSRIQPSYFIRHPFYVRL
ncbi:MAG: hypothetical protein AABN95_17150 [Acidobacteriota bacterium]